MKGPWIGVDLDGTLAEYHGWKGINHIGEPISTMVERVKAWLVAGQTVKIFTARVCADQDGYTIDTIKAIIQGWCVQHLGVALEVTNIKDFGMIQLWDDRCIQVVPNKGVPILESHQWGGD